MTAGVTGNLPRAQQLEAGALQLQELHTQATTLSAQQAALTTAKQETTKELRRVLREGDALADFLRTGARAHFGADSEKMIEFGMQPFRGRKVKSDPPTSPEAPATPVPDPAK